MYTSAKRTAVCTGLQCVVTGCTAVVVAEATWSLCMYEFAWAAWSGALQNVHHHKQADCLFARITNVHIASTACCVDSCTHTRQSPTVCAFIISTYTHTICKYIHTIANLVHIHTNHTCTSYALYMCTLYCNREVSLLAAKTTVTGSTTTCATRVCALGHTLLSML
jgi:hypothetical protein